MNETLSALMDAELHAREREKLLDRMVGDDELRAVWGRYHVTQAVLRGEWEGGLKSDLSGRVLAAVAEPSWDQGSRLTQVLPRRRGYGGFKGRPAARFALAASLTAGAALFGLHMAVVGRSMPAGATAPALKTALVAPLALPRRYIERAHWQGPRWRDRLNAFLLEHSAVAPLAGMNGLSYVRLAAYNGAARGTRNKP